MHINEILVLIFICNGRMTGIGKVANKKSVKMLIAGITVRNLQMECDARLTSIE